MTLAKEEVVVGARSVEVSQLCKARSAASMLLTCSEPRSTFWAVARLSSRDWRLADMEARSFLAADGSDVAAAILSEVLPESMDRAFFTPSRAAENLCGVGVGRGRRGVRRVRNKGVARFASPHLFDARSPLVPSTAA